MADGADAHVAVPRAVYDATAEQYASLIGTDISGEVEGPLDRAVLAAFAEMAADGRPRPVADVGCGPGRVAAFLSDRGLDVEGVDLSPAMLAVARRAHPAIRFREAALTGLPFDDGALAGAAYWYSIIHTPPDLLDAVWSELARVLAPGGVAVVGFQAGGGEAVRREDAYGTAMALISHRHRPDHVASGLSSAGIRVEARAEREPRFAHEAGPQAFLLARRAPDQR